MSTRNIEVAKNCLTALGCALRQDPNYCSGQEIQQQLDDISRILTDENLSDDEYECFCSRHDIHQYQMCWNLYAEDDEETINEG